MSTRGRRTKATKAKATKGMRKTAQKRSGGTHKTAPRARAIDPEQRHAMISEVAYLRAERRGFQEGDPMQDWLEAEAEIDATLGKPAGDRDRPRSAPARPAKKQPRRTTRRKPSKRVTPG